MLISIIMPYFRKKKYVKYSVKSILNQSYKNFELLIVYDDYKFNDLALINKIKNLDKRIKIIINKTNQGAGYSRNIGINHSKGNYIAFLDADDIWKKDKLLKQINFMKKMGSKISHTSYEIINNRGLIIGQRKAHLMTFKKMMKSCDVGLSSVILKKNILNKNIKFPNLETKEDFVLWLKITKKGINIDPLDINLMLWRNTENSLSSSIIRKLMDGYAVYRKFLNFSRLKSFFYLALLSLNYLKKI